MANKNENPNPGQQSQDKKTDARNQETGNAPGQKKGSEVNDQNEVTNEGSVQAGGTRKPDRTNEGEREGNSNDRKPQTGNEEGGMGGNQTGKGNNR